MVFNTGSTFNEKLLLTSQFEREFSILTWPDCANLNALHLAFIFPLTARQHLSSSSSDPTGNLVKIKTEKKKDLIDYQTELLEGSLSPFLAWFWGWPTMARVETGCWKQDAVMEHSRWLGWLVAGPHAVYLECLCWLYANLLTRL